MYSLAEHQKQCQRSLFLHLMSEILLLCFYGASLWLWQFLWQDHMLEVFTPSTSMYGVKCLKKSTNKRVTSRLFIQTPKILWIVRICNFEDWFLHKPFWFFLRIFLISGIMHLSSRAFWISYYGSKGNTSVVLGNSEVSFLW